MIPSDPESSGTHSLDILGVEFVGGGTFRQARRWFAVIDEEEKAQRV
jgi:hypothetical protein